MNNLDEIISDIENIKQRNIKVELDKKWETSWTRRLFIVFVTYTAVCLYLHITEDKSPFVGAVIPSGAYIISTLALPFVRKLWSRFNQRQQ